MKKFRYISPFRYTQYYELEELRKGPSEEAKARSRAHAILLSLDRFTIEELMEIFKVKRDTISRWLNNWEQCGLDGLHDKSRSGRIPTLNEDEQNVLKELIKENPRSSKVVAQKLFNQTGKKLSHWSVMRLAKDFGLSWKRVRKSCKSICSEKKFRKAKSELEALERVALTSAKMPPKNETKEKPRTKVSDSDIKVFKQLIDRDRIILDEAQNSTKVVKPKTKVGAPKTASSKEVFLSEVVQNKEPLNEGSQFNETNELHQQKPECETFKMKSVPFDETKDEEVICADFLDETNEIHYNSSPKMITEPSEVETGKATQSNTNKPFNKDILDVVYFDATGFDLVLRSPYAWQDKGRKNTICLPSKTSKRINVLGFLNKIHHELIPFVFEETVTADVVVEIFDAFSAQIQNPTLVVMDNASIHTSDHFFNLLSNWQEKGLFPYFLPTYSPELNAIEILWRKIKYEWLSFSAYDHFKKLQEAVDEVLIHFGTKYLITFA